MVGTAELEALSREWRLFMESLSQDEIFQLLKIVEDSSFDELYLEMGGLKLTLKKHAGSEPGPIPYHTKVDGGEPYPPLDAERPDADERMSFSIPEKQKTASIEGPQEAGYIHIRSPMLGTFYRASKPGAPPFVEEGRMVDADDTVCIIEVMKLFNTVKSGVKGRIAKVLVRDGEMVEFQQTLFLVTEAEEAERTGKGTI